MVGVPESCTDEAQGSKLEIELALAWPFGRLPDAEVSAVAEALELAQETSRAEVYEALDDAERVRGILRSLPVLSLVLLELLVEADGMLGRERALWLLRERSGCDYAKGLRAAEERAYDGGLIVRVAPPDEQWDVSIALIAPAAAHVARWLRGLTLPCLPAGLAASADGAMTPGRGLRDLLAFAGAAAQDKLLFTKSREPNRSSTSRVARRLGLDADHVEQAYRDAIRVDLLGGDATGRLWPRIEQLRAAARGERTESRPASYAERWLARNVPTEAWVSEEALCRAFIQQEADEVLDWLPSQFGAPVVMLEGQILRATRCAVGYDRWDDGDALWLRRWTVPSPSEGSRGDGHVTPSFDVLLGPAAELDLLVTVALACELVQLDRMLSFRITPASVAAGRAAGLALDALLDALRGVGSHGLPRNVEGMVRDWYGTAGVGDASADRADEVPVLPFAVAHRARYLGCEAELFGWNGSESGSADRREQMWGSEGGEDVEEPDEWPPPLRCEADPVLRARWERAVADGFAEERRTLGGSCSHANGEPSGDDDQP